MSLFSWSLAHATVQKRLPYFTSPPQYLQTGLANQCHQEFVAGRVAIKVDVVQRYASAILAEGHRCRSLWENKPNANKGSLHHCSPADVDVGTSVSGSGLHQNMGWLLRCGSSARADTVDIDARQCGKKGRSHGLRSSSGRQYC